jgi:hypothetical protein
VGDGSDAGQVQGRHRGREDEGAGEFGHGRPPIEQLALRAV